MPCTDMNSACASDSTEMLRRCEAAEAGGRMHLCAGRGMWNGGIAGPAAAPSSAAVSRVFGIPVQP
jgi:hypothetical protein